MDAADPANQCSDLAHLWHHWKRQGHDHGEFNHSGALTVDVVFQTDFLARQFVSVS
jgi:hypothetical protein